MLLPLGTGNRACRSGPNWLGSGPLLVNASCASWLRAAGGIKTGSRAVVHAGAHRPPRGSAHLCTPAPVPVKCRFTAPHGKTEGAKGSEWERVRDRFASLVREDACVDRCDERDFAPVA